MKKFALLVAMVLVLVMATATMAMAGKTSTTATYWRVTGIQDTHYNGLLIQREVRLGQSQYPDEDVSVKFGPSDPAWPDIKKIQKGDWLWVNTMPGNQIMIIFGLMPPAQTELGNIID